MFGPLILVLAWCCIILGEAMRMRDFVLHGVTILEPPYIYSESGPYRGFCIDVLEAISGHLGFNYTLRQTVDGQIGSVAEMNGVFAELDKEYADFAIGSISGNWINDPAKALASEIIFTKPILVSTLSVLISKTLYNELLKEKNAFCRTKRANQTKTGISLCKEEGLSIEYLFETGYQLNRWVVKNSAAYVFYARHHTHMLGRLEIVDRAALLTRGLQQLKRRNNAVLIDESSFTHYRADRDCEFTLIDANRHRLDKLGNVRFDTMETGSMVKQETTFKNDIVIALSKRFVDFQRRAWGHDWHSEFNRIIDSLERSGKLRELQEKHWKSRCLASGAWQPRINGIIGQTLVIVSILFSNSILKFG